MLNHLPLERFVIVCSPSICFWMLIHLDTVHKWSPGLRPYIFSQNTISSSLKFIPPPKPLSTNQSFTLIQLCLFLRSFSITYMYTDRSFLPRRNDIFRGWLNWCPQDSTPVNDIPTILRFHDDETQAVSCFTKY